MTVRSSRLFPSLIVATAFFTGCVGKSPMVSHRCQVLVVLDKTNSVSYVKKRSHIQDALVSNFNRTYAAATVDIQSSLLVVTDNTNVFPQQDRFAVSHPEGDEDSRPYQQALTRWNIEKRKWLAERVKDIICRIDSPCHSNRTDIFSIFSGIGQAQKDNGPWDSLVVVIFSDMVQTCRPMNMRTGLTMSNAQIKGKTICSDLMTRGELPRVGNENLYFTIYTPDEVENSGLVYQFWAGFFEQWGLKADQYHFE